MVWASVKVVLFIILLLLSSLHIVTQLIPLSVTLALVAPRWGSYLNSNVVHLWHWYTVTLCEHLLGVTVVVTGTPPTKTRPTLILMNHRTRLDWLFYFCCHARYASLGNLRICLKEVLKHMPGAGWGIQGLAFLFIKRIWENDQLVFRRCVRYYSQVGLRPEILLFPEGTDLTPTTKERSDRFAAENNLPRHRHLLHPRTKGFIFLVQNLNEYFRHTDIVDITVAYPHNLCQSEGQLLLGNIPKEVHFHLETVPATSVPRDPEELETMCHSLWRRKERLLDHFHNHHHFPQGASDSFRTNTRFKLTKLTSGMLWIVHTVLSTVLLCCSPVVQVYYLCGLCVYTVSVISFGGLDVLIPYLETSSQRLFCEVKRTNCHGSFK